MLRSRRARKGGGQVAQGIEGVDGAELIHMGHHRADAAGHGLEAVEAQERVEPDDTLCLAAQALHFMFQRVDALAVETIGHDQHMRALGQHAAGPFVIELLERGADAGAAGPVLHRA